MAPRNPSNPGASPSFLDSWPATNLTAEWLAVIRAYYHIFSHAVCGLSFEEVLMTAQLEVSPMTIKEEVMVVYEAQLKCGLTLPLSTFLLQLCEGWGICVGQLAQNAPSSMRSVLLAMLWMCSPCLKCFPSITSL